MQLFIRTTLILALAGGAALAEPAGDKATPKARWGSVARQLMLKYRLQKIATGTLATSLDHNRRRWESLSPDQREQYRRDALAFEQKSLADQEKLLKHYDKLIKLPADKREAYRRRARWLKVVAASFTAEQRRRLMALPPDQRARKLLERKARLIRQGKLKDDGATAPRQGPQGPGARPAPATRPAEPTTQPAE